MVLNFKSLNKEIKKGLYLIPTPIGNLEDITFRAVEILKKSDYILCEDTRISKNLFKRYEIKSKLIANHKFNERKNLSKIVELLKSGLIISLVSSRDRVVCVTKASLLGFFITIFLASSNDSIRYIFPFESAS